MSFPLNSVSLKVWRRILLCLFFIYLKSPAEEQYNIKANVIIYNQNTDIIEARGNVTISSPDSSKILKADYIIFNRKTKKAEAIGNVTYYQEGEVWRGEKLSVNLDTKVITVKSVSAEMQPLRLLKADSIIASNKMYYIQNPIITTCTNDTAHVHFFVTSELIVFKPEDFVKGYNTLWVFGPIPIFFFPYWYKDLQGEFGYRFKAGVSNRMGAYLLSGIRYKLLPWLKAQTHLDIRTRRGIGLGQDFEIKEEDKILDIKTYWLKDSNPVDKDETTETVRNKRLDCQRYRTSLFYSQQLSGSDSLSLNLDYHSDQDILEDFFEDEYRLQSQPENFLSLTHKENLWIGGILFRFRLNDFYPTVERLPKIWLDVPRTPVMPYLFYQSQNAAERLDKKWEFWRTNEIEGSIFRFDTKHMFTVPFELFNFLNITPKVGYRATYYSKTLYNSYCYEGTNLIEKVSLEGDADIRSVYELGCELSFKMFKLFDVYNFPARHIVEPFLEYTFIPEPNITPERLYQFDEIDKINKTHSLKIGMRNKLQIKHENKIYEIVDALLYSTLNLLPDYDLFENIVLDAELRGAKKISSDIRIWYNVPDRSVEKIDTTLKYIPDSELWNLSLTLFHVENEKTLLEYYLSIFPEKAWQFEINTRFDFKDTRLEEQWLFIQRNLDCISICIGGGVMPGYRKEDGTRQEDDWRITFEMWLRAFPKLRIGKRHKQ